MGKDGAGPNVPRWNLLKHRDLASGPMTDPGYTVLRDYYLPMTKSLVEGTIAKDKLDAIIYPTGAQRAAQIATVAPPREPGRSATGIANLTGFPDLIVPAGFTTDDLPVTVSFFGPAFSEPKLLALGYSFEQITHARRRPVNTPALKDATVSISGAE